MENSSPNPLFHLVTSEFKNKSAEVLANPLLTEAVHLLHFDYKMRSNNLFGLLILLSSEYFFNHFVSSVFFVIRDEY